MTDLTSRFTVVEIDNPYRDRGGRLMRRWQSLDRVYQVCFDGKPLDREITMTRQEADNRITFLADAALTANWLASSEDD